MSPGPRGFAEMPPLGVGYWQDQHGRTVVARTDAGGNPVAQFNIKEGDGFHLPPGCHPPQDAFRILATDGAVKRGEWNYSKVIAEQQEAAELFERTKGHFMQEHFGQALTATTEVPPLIWRKLGPPPMPWQIMDAARVGVAYVVHGTGPMPPVLKPYFDQIALMRHAPSAPEAMVRSQYEQGLESTPAWVDDVADNMEDEAAELARKAKDAARKRAARSRALEAQEA